MPRPGGGRLDIQLLRPIEWVQACGAVAGAVVELDLAELGAQGPATVLAVEPCPPIEPATPLRQPGRVVTGTFHHVNARVLDLHVEGLAEPIGVTANHPIWSEDRQDFVPAGDLQIGERLRRLDDRPDGRATARVLALAPRAPPPPPPPDVLTPHPGVLSPDAPPPGQTGFDVYNLEVHDQHVYYVGDDGLLVHNAYSKQDVIYVNPAGEAISAKSLSRQGRSRLAGNFQGLAGANVEEVISRVPHGWKWAPQRSGSGIRFFDASGRERLRMHAANPNAPLGSNSRRGWTLRVTDRVGNYFDDLGRIQKNRFTNAGHIPLAGNPNAP